jgi:mRNA interferase RelE/StbE
MPSDAYRISLAARARNHLARIDQVARRRIAAAISALATEPRPHGCKPLKGMPGTLRIRVGDYRIVYTVADTDREVEVIDVDHRKDIYR